MKKIYSALLLVFALISCVNNTSKQKEQMVDEKAKYPIVGFVENFVAAHPNFDSNDITREKADEDFISEFRNLSDSINLIQGIPVKLEALNNINDGKVMAQFQSWIKPYNFQFPGSINDVNFDVVGRIDNKYVDILDEDTYYVIHGRFIDRIKNLPAFYSILGKSSSVYTPMFSVRKDDIWDDKYEVSLGMMYYEIDSISKFEP